MNDAANRPGVILRVAKAADASLERYYHTLAGLAILLSGGAIKLLGR